MHPLDLDEDVLPPEFEISRALIGHVQMAAIVDNSMPTIDLFGLVIRAVMELEKRVLILEGRIEYEE